MGAANSSNVADAITNVSNAVSNATVVTNSQVTNEESKVNLTNCQVKLSGNFNIEDSAKMMTKNTQIVKATQDSNIMNNIQQKMLQEATSTVGTMGIGYASASNSASEMVNTSNQVVNALHASASQYADINQSFDCNNSTIIAKNLNIGFNSSEQLLSSQTISNDQVANIVNDITQSITQKATATVEGISGMLLLIILGIGIIIYVAMKPLSSGGVKMIVGVIMCFIVFCVITLMYIRGSAPFFNDLDQCINNSYIGMGGGVSGNLPNCVDYKVDKLSLTNPPLKYIYGVGPFDISKPGGNLVQIAIASKAGSDCLTAVNNGYLVQTCLDLNDSINKYTQYKDLGIPQIPNPLTYYTTQPDYSSCGGSSGSGKYFAVPLTYSVDIVKSGGNVRSCMPGVTSVIYTTSDCSDSGFCSTASNSKCFNCTDDATNAVANLNTQGWSDYLNMTGNYPPSNNYTGTDEATTRALYARFVLCDIIGNMDLQHYILDEELVKFIDDNDTIHIMKAGDAKIQYPDHVYKYHPYSYPGNWRNGIIGPGYIYGKIGVVDNNKNRFIKFSQKIGKWIMLGILGLIFLFMGYTWYKNKDKYQQTTT